MTRIAGTGKQSLMKSNWGCVYANGFVVLSEGLYMFRLGAVVTGGNINQSRNSSLQNNWLDGIEERETEGAGQSETRLLQNVIIYL
jgi:hypothetical protein